MIAQVRHRWSRFRTRLEGIPTRWLLAPTIGILLAISISTVAYWSQLWPERGTDYHYFVAQADRWVSGDGFYVPRQLTGPYVMTIHDNKYPPPALLLFLPFVWLPGLLWWVIPLVAIVIFVIRQRPAPWAWPLIAVACLPPRTLAIVLWGNSTMWVAAFVALGLWAAWPSLLIMFKPYFAPFMLIGVHRRAWWLAAFALLVVNIGLIPTWAEYLTAWRNAGASWPSLDYSPLDLLILSIPLVAWLARTRSPAVPSGHQKAMSRG